MNTQEKCEEILKRILALCNEGKMVTLEGDFGGNTLTIYVDGSHTHAGHPGSSGTFDILADNLYNTLTGGPGLSWA